VRRGIVDDIPVRDERRLNVAQGAAHVCDVDPVLDSADALDLGDAMGCGPIPLQPPPSEAVYDRYPLPD
jgi:hypothetical protein